MLRHLDSVMDRGVEQAIDMEATSLRDLLRVQLDSVAVLLGWTGKVRLTGKVRENSVRC